MPYFGLLPFLQGMKLELIFDKLVCVNALLRASPISTFESIQLIKFVYVCQCPTSGFSHFYQQEEV